MESGIMGKGLESWMPVTPGKPVGSMGLNAGIEFTAANAPTFGEYTSMSFTELLGSFPGINNVESCSAFQTNPISGTDVPATPPVPQRHIEDAGITKKRHHIDIDLNKRPRKKHKVKRHRPKVLIVGKPSKPPKRKQSAPKADTSRPPTPRRSTPKPRKYVRKKDISGNDDLKGLEAIRTSIHLSPECVSRKTCRGALNFSLQEVDANPISHNVVEQSDQAVNFNCSFRNPATPKGSMHKWKKLASFICKKRRMPRQKRTVFNIVSSIIAKKTSVSRLKRAYNKRKPVGKKLLASRLDDKRVEKAIRKCNLSIVGCNFEKVKEFHQLVLPTLNQIQEAVADPDSFKCVLSLIPFLRSKRKRSKGLTRGRGSWIKAFEFEKCRLPSAGLIDNGNCYSQYQDVNGKLPLLLQQNESVDFEKCTPSQEVVLVHNECKQLVVPDAHSNRELVKYDPPKKQKHRAEVVFDDGTLIVWNQLMGIKGSDHPQEMDKDTEQKWNEDRELFRGKVDAFLALMHSIQGDRKFIPWNGSVVDSVVGVYLTQNVTDTLSSDAFMSLAAKYPVKPRKKDSYDVEVVCSQESTVDNDINVVVEEEVCHVNETGENMKDQCGDFGDETLPKCGYMISDAFPFGDMKNEISTSFRKALDTEEINFLEQFCCDEDKNLVSTKGERESQSSQAFTTEVSTAPFDLNVSSQDVLGFGGNMEMEIKDNCDSNGMNECQSHSGCGSSETIHQNNVGPEEHEAQTADPKSLGKSLQSQVHSSTSEREVKGTALRQKKSKGEREPEIKIDWEALRKMYCDYETEESEGDTQDSVDWDAVRHAAVEEIAATIEKRGMHNILAGRIKAFLDRLVNDHGKIDLEWLRKVPAPEAKKFLLSIPGIGLKSVECVRLLTLHHHAFPVDTNVARVAVRLGWVPVEPLEGVPLHFLNAFPDMDTIQRYLYPRLYNVPLPIVYKLHCQTITFGKVFCTKQHPNCAACPMRPECKHYASLSSEKLALPAPKDKRIVPSDIPFVADEHSPNPPVAPLGALYISDSSDPVRNCEPIVEHPASPEPASQEPELVDIEDLFSHPDEEIPTIALNTEKFNENECSTVETYEMLKCQVAEMSKALVALPPEIASIPVRKMKHTSRLKTVHRVYELPDSHPILTKFERRQPCDPCPYLFAMAPTDESSASPEQTQQGGDSHGSETGGSNEDPHMVAGTILIPCRTATRGRFPLNGTYFQVNEVFADDETSRRPISVPRTWLWNLPVRYVYCGTSVTNILNSRPLKEIIDCFGGFLCVRGFDKETRVPRPLHRRFHLSVTQQAKEKQLTSRSKRNPPKEG